MHEQDAVRHRFAYHTLISVPGREPAEGVHPQRPIVVGVNGTAGSGAALRWSIDQARDRDAQVIVVHALPVATGFVYDVPALTPTAWRRDLRTRILSEWCEPLVDAGVPYRAVLVERPVRAALLGVAERRDAGSIVIGSGDVNGTRHRILAGLYAALIEHAPCPVVAVPVSWLSTDAQLAKSQLSPLS